MKMRQLSLIVIVVLSLSFAVEFALGQKKRPAPPKAANSKLVYQTNMAKAVTNFKKRSFLMAANFAIKAIEQRSNEPQAYLIAIRSFSELKDFDKAFLFTEDARKNCRESDLQEIESLAIDVQRERSQHETIGRAEAFAKSGNALGAAENYKAAFLGDPSREDLGLKAAFIYNDLLKNYDEAISIVRRILLMSNKPQILSDAKDLLRVAEVNNEMKAESDRKAKAETALKDGEERERQQREAREREQASEQERVQSQIRELVGSRCY